MAKNQVIASRCYADRGSEASAIIFMDKFSDDANLLFGELLKHFLSKPEIKYYFQNYISSKHFFKNEPLSFEVLRKELVKPRENIYPKISVRFGLDCLNFEHCSFTLKYLRTFILRIPPSFRKEMFSMIFLLLRQPPHKSMELPSTLALPFDPRAECFGATDSPVSGVCQSVHNFEFSLQLESSVEAYSSESDTFLQSEGSLGGIDVEGNRRIKNDSMGLIEVFLSESIAVPSGKFHFIDAKLIHNESPKELSGIGNSSQSQLDAVTCSNNASFNSVDVENVLLKTVDNVTCEHGSVESLMSDINSGHFIGQKESSSAIDAALKEKIFISEKIACSLSYLQMFFELKSQRKLWWVIIQVLKDVKTYFLNLLAVDQVDLIQNSFVSYISNNKQHNSRCPSQKVSTLSQQEKESLYFCYTIYFCGRLHYNSLFDKFQAHNNYVPKLITNEYGNFLYFKRLNDLFSVNESGIVRVCLLPLEVAFHPCTSPYVFKCYDNSNLISGDETLVSVRYSDNLLYKKFFATVSFLLHAFGTPSYSHLIKSISYVFPDIRIFLSEMSTEKQQEVFSSIASSGINTETFWKLVSAKSSEYYIYNGKLIALHIVYSLSLHGKIHFAKLVKDLYTSAPQITISNFSAEDPRWYRHLKRSKFWEFSSDGCVTLHPLFYSTVRNVFLESENSSSSEDDVSIPDTNCDFQEQYFSENDGNSSQISIIPCHEFPGASNTHELTKSEIITSFKGVGPNEITRHLIEMSNFESTSFTSESQTRLMPHILEPFKSVTSPTNNQASFIKINTSEVNASSCPSLSEDFEENNGEKNTLNRSTKLNNLWCRDELIFKRLCASVSFLVYSFGPLHCTHLTKCVSYVLNDVGAFFNSLPQEKRLEVFSSIPLTDLENSLLQLTASYELETKYVSKTKLRLLYTVSYLALNGKTHYIKLLEEFQKSASHTTVAGFNDSIWIGFLKNCFKYIEFSPEDYISLPSTFDSDCVGNNDKSVINKCPRSLGIWCKDELIYKKFCASVSFLVHSFGPLQCTHLTKCISHVLKDVGPFLNALSRDKRLEVFASIPSTTCNDNFVHLVSSYALDTKYVTKTRFRLLYMVSYLGLKGKTHFIKLLEDFYESGLQVNIDFFSGVTDPGWFGYFKGSSKYFDFKSGYLSLPSSFHGNFNQAALSGSDTYAEIKFFDKLVASTMQIKCSEHGGTIISQSSEMKNAAAPNEMLLSARSDADGNSRVAESNILEKTSESHSLTPGLKQNSCKKTIKILEAQESTIFNKKCNISGKGSSFLRNDASIQQTRNNFFELSASDSSRNAVYQSTISDGLDIVKRIDIEVRKGIEFLLKYFACSLSPHLVCVVLHVLRETKRLFVLLPQSDQIILVENILASVSIVENGSESFELLSETFELTREQKNLLFISYVVSLNEKTHYSTLLDKFEENNIHIPEFTPANSYFKDRNMLFSMDRWGRVELSNFPPVEWLSKYPYHLSNSNRIPVDHSGIAKTLFMGEEEKCTPAKDVTDPTKITNMKNVSVDPQNELEYLCEKIRDSIIYLLQYFELKLNSGFLEVVLLVVEKRALFSGLSQSQQQKLLKMSFCPLHIDKEGTLSSNHTQAEFNLTEEEKLVLYASYVIYLKGKMHYRQVFKEYKEYVGQSASLNDSGKFKFFKRRNDLFSIESSGYVKLVNVPVIKWDYVYILESEMCCSLDSVIGTLEVTNSTCNTVNPVDCPFAKNTSKLFKVHLGEDLETLKEKAQFSDGVSGRTGLLEEKKLIERVTNGVSYLSHYFVQMPHINPVHLLIQALEDVRSYYLSLTTLQSRDDFVRKCISSNFVVSRGSDTYASSKSLINDEEKIVLFISYLLSDKKELHYIKIFDSFPKYSVAKPNSVKNLLDLCKFIEQFKNVFSISPSGNVSLIPMSSTLAGEMLADGASSPTSMLTSLMVNTSLEDENTEIVLSGSSASLNAGKFYFGSNEKQNFKELNVGKAIVTASKFEENPTIRSNDVLPRMNVNWCQSPILPSFFEAKKTDVLELRHSVQNMSKPVKDKSSSLNFTDTQPVFSGKCAAEDIFFKKSDCSQEKFDYLSKKICNSIIYLLKYFQLKLNSRFLEVTLIVIKKRSLFFGLSQSKQQKLIERIFSPFRIDEQGYIIFPSNFMQRELNVSEEERVELCVSHILNQNGIMHYRQVFKQYHKSVRHNLHLSDSEQFSFLKERHHLFLIASSGYVKLVSVPAIKWDYVQFVESDKIANSDESSEIKEVTNSTIQTRVQNKVDTNFASNTQKSIKKNSPLEDDLKVPLDDDSKCATGISKETSYVCAEAVGKGHSTSLKYRNTDFKSNATNYLKEIVILDDFSSISKCENIPTVMSDVLVTGQDASNTKWCESPNVSAFSKAKTDAPKFCSPSDVSSILNTNLSSFLDYCDRQPFFSTRNIPGSFEANKILALECPNVSEDMNASETYFSSSLISVDIQPPSSEKLVSGISDLSKYDDTSTEDNTYLYSSDLQLPFSGEIVVDNIFSSTYQSNLTDVCAALSWSESSIYEEDEFYYNDLIDFFLSIP